MSLDKIISLLKGACNKIFTCWSNAFYLLNLKQINPEQRYGSSVESLETKNQQETLTISQTILTPTISAQTILAQTTLENKLMINISMLQDTLQNFVTSTPEVQGVSLVSPDGLSLASVLPARMDEERTAAMSASILSLGERIGGELACGNVERIVVGGEKGYSVLVGCGSEAVLLVLANSTAKQGLLFLEIKRVVNQIAELLS